MNIYLLLKNSQKYIIKVIKIFFSNKNISNKNIFVFIWYYGILYGI